MKPKKKIWMISCSVLLTAVITGGIFFVQKSSNRLSGSTSLGKSHEATEHSTGYVVCRGWMNWSEQTGSLQEIFEQKKEAAEKALLAELAAEQELQKEEQLAADQQKADYSKELTAGTKTPVADNKTPAAGNSASGTKIAAVEETQPVTGTPSGTPEEQPPAQPEEQQPAAPAEQPAEEPAPNLCPYPLWTVMSFDDGTMGYYWPMDFDIADAARVDQELAELHYIKLVSTTFVGNYDDAYHVRLSKFRYFIPPLA